MNDNVITKIEKDVIERFKNEPVLNKSPFSVESNVRWKKNSYSAEYDIVIKYDGIPYAVVEIKRSLLNKFTFEHAKRITTLAFKLVNCNYAIITDNNDFYICDSRNTDNYQKLDFPSIISVLQKNADIQNVANELLCGEIESILKKHNMESFVAQLGNTNGQYSFKGKSESDFWCSLLEQNGESVTKIYRYTTLDTVFFLLKNGTFRMNGIIGMNDKSEIDYFDDYCYTSKNKPSYQILNNLYLSSCSLLYDNLTMWRLYGDEAKGVCLTFELNDKNTQDFLLQSVSYAKDTGKNDKLDLIKQLISKHFVFKDIDKWKHFFKAKDYSVEEEIRLLYMDDESNKIVKNRDWLKTNDSLIINPYVEFDIDSEGFPLTLTEVMLGPKCPEIATNQEQLKELIRQKGYSIAVEQTSIKNYR